MLQDILKHAQTMSRGCGCQKNQTTLSPVGKVPLPQAKPLPVVPLLPLPTAAPITSPLLPPTTPSLTAMSTCSALVAGLCGTGTGMCDCAHAQITSLGMSYYRVLFNLINGVGTITCGQLLTGAQSYIACRGGSSITFNDPTVVGSNAIISLIPPTGCSTIPAEAVSEANCILKVFNTFCLPS